MMEPVLSALKLILILLLILKEFYISGTNPRAADLNRHRIHVPFYSPGADGVTVPVQAPASFPLVQSGCAEGICARFLVSQRTG